VSLVNSIPVRDANGDQIVVYEFHEWRFLQKVRSFKLDTDERVEQLDEDTFVLASGEKLTRLTG
jgi:hypothetical protein